MTTDVSTQRDSTAAPVTPGALARGAHDIPATFAERVELCRFLAEADILPPRLRGQPANLMLIMHKALALDVPLSVAVDHINVLDGGTTEESAELLRGLLYRHGHRLRWIKHDGVEAHAELTLAHDPRPREERFSIGDAQRMGLVTKDTYQADPESMLVARCSTRAVSRNCPEIALGVGNLSRMDMAHLLPEDSSSAPKEVPEEAETAPEETAEDSAARQQAHTLLDQARAASTASVVTHVGRQAKRQELLTVPVDDDGTTLQTALLARLNALSGVAEDSTAASVPDGDSQEQVATLDETTGTLDCGCEAAEVFRTGSHRDDCTTTGSTRASRSSSRSSSARSRKTGTRGSTKTRASSQPDADQGQEGTE
ncbi:hypothetical protein [Actinopolyspora erythraea]|uniref:hypothetical protein n=1 Tax=Actinopolyspora erythraea TaxID=414996 RepID=UPI0012B62245|nr:hypothetical protein [Actinopolyspora erythraea]